MKDVLITYDYYAGGSIMPGRSFNAGSYRYGGAGGQEMDNEIYGSAGTSYTAEYWQYDSRLVRRWNVDPMTYPWQSSYAAFNNNPIYFIDPLGLFGTRKEARAAKQSEGFSGRIRKSDSGGFEIYDRKGRGTVKGSEFASGGFEFGIESDKSFKTKVKEAFSAIGDYLTRLDNKMGGYTMTGDRGDVTVGNGENTGLPSGHLNVSPVLAIPTPGAELNKVAEGAKLFSDGVKEFVEKSPQPRKAHNTVHGQQLTPTQIREDALRQYNLYNVFINQEGDMWKTTLGEKGGFGKMSEVTKNTVEYEKLKGLAQPYYMDNK